MEPDLFPSLPADLASLSVEELEALREEYRASGRAVRDGEAEVGDLANDPAAGEKVLAAMKQAKLDVDAIDAELTVRTDGEAEFDRQAAELLGAMGVEDAVALAAEDDPAPDPDPDPDPEAEPIVELAAEAETPEGEPETAPVEEPAEALVAAAAPVRLPARSRRFDPLPAQDGAVAVLTASSGIDGYREGLPLDRLEFAKATIAKMSRLPVQHHKGGSRESFSIGRISWPIPDERRLRRGDLEGNTEKIRSIGSPFLGYQALEVFMASGGHCAPMEPIYAVPSIGTTARPVRDALPSFVADRGGVSVPTPFTASDLADGITVVEGAADALGGTFSTKACFSPDCPVFTDVEVGIISHCVGHGNLNARAWPEFVSQISDETLVQHSRVADGRLLDRIDALSIHTTSAATATYGASASLLWALQLSRSHIISTLRLDPGTRFRAILPFYAAEMFSQDLVNSQFGRFDTAPAQVGALLARYGIDVTWHLDQALLGGATVEVFPAQSAGAEADWLSTTVVARVFPDGTFLHLDGGSLDFGLVRDSTLNETNDFELMAEIFENVARIGPAQAAHRILITACPSGAVANPATAITCS